MSAVVPRERTRIGDSVGLWGTPVNRFRVFKSGVWHVVWPNEMFARRCFDEFGEACAEVAAAIGARR